VPKKTHLPKGCVFEISGTLVVYESSAEHKKMQELFLSFVAQAWRGIGGFIPVSGLFVSIFGMLWSSADEQSIKRQIYGAIAGFAVLFGPAAFFLLPMAIEFILDAEPPHYEAWKLGAAAFTAVFGFMLAVVYLRVIEPKIYVLQHKFTKKSILERNQKTDVRDIAKHLPRVEKDYNPLTFVDVKKGVFVGLDEAKKAVYVSADKWRKSHVQLIGTTGAGKGVAGGLLCAQSVELGEAVFVVDPKNDEWAPHLLRQQCEAAGKPFHLINLRDHTPQLDFMADMQTGELKELLTAGFSLAEKGEAADHYRIFDRKAARTADALAKDVATLNELYHHEAIQNWEEEAAGFVNKLEELSLLGAINAPGGLNLKRVMDEGGCVYIVGSMRESAIITCQRMLLIRLMQLAEQRDRTHEAPRPVCIFLDEFKYHISKPAMEALGAARDKGVHVILAHQSLDDCRDCPADLDGDAVIGAVVENCKLRIAYKVQNPETAKWLAEMSGTILVDDEARKVDRNAALAETIEHERTVRQAERFYIDANMLQNLPDRCAVFYGVDLPKPVHICPIPTTKQDLKIYDAPPAPAPKTAADLLALDDAEPAQTLAPTEVFTEEDEIFDLKDF
jgi:hypothetical protein